MRRFPRSVRIKQVLAPRGLVVMLGLLLPLLAGCPGSLEGNFPPLTGAGGSTGTGGMTGTGGGGVCDAPNMVLKGCHLGCHAAGGTPPDLMTDPLATHLVGVAAVSSLAPCSGMPLINHANPASSVILTRLSGTTCGSQMPLTGPPFLDATAMACVTSWVMAQ